MAMTLRFRFQNGVGQPPSRLWHATGGSMFYGLPRRAGKRSLRITPEPS